ncbi:MAG: GAF domain-containing sensor histidine kinase, partial [Anaerolineaceae bacterium]|nr:GAF domain-containing sensor histidine kinase [Anaerolineaceae bacterium]
RVHHRSKTPGMLWKTAEVEIGEGMVGQTALNGQPNLMNLPASSQSSELHSAVNQGRYHQIACFPLNGRQGALGVLCAATNNNQPLGELEIQFLAAISSWIGTAIENVRLNLQQRRLAILEERERIGMDLHDGVIQSIYAVGLTLEHARLLMPSETEHATQRIETAISDLNSTIRDIRSYILDLRPRQLHDENLMQGIQRLVNELRANTLVEVNLHAPDDGLAQIPINLTLALFHICQEALANTAKHARARQVDVNLWTTPDRVLLEVQDDGLGFDTAKIKRAIGHGLSNMHTRARNVGGDVDITSEPGAGTTVLTWVPYIRNT